MTDKRSKTFRRNIGGNLCDLGLGYEAMTSYTQRHAL